MPLRFKPSTLLIRVLGAKCNYVTLSLQRHLSGISDELQRQNDIFNFEKNRQKEAVGRIEKIDVQYEGVPENCYFVMNKNISTPYDCAKHLGDKVRDRSVVAVLNKKKLWHMHKPLPDSCILELLHFKSQNPSFANKIFWRTCSFLLGAVASNAFKSNVELYLHSFPVPNVKSGSFVYDIQLSLDNWTPTKSELKVLGLEFIKFCQKEQQIECLDVTENLALEIFKSNPHKTEQIPDIGSKTGGKVTLYKVGSHIDISCGPMLPNTSHVGRVSVTNVIKLDTDVKGSPIYRFQGVALPRVIYLNQYAYGLIEERGQILNSARLPGDQGAVGDDNAFVAHMSQ